jgi:hypothetical protein
MSELFSSYDDSNQMFVKDKLFSSIFLHIGSSRKTRIDSLHKTLKIIDLITLACMLIGVIFTVMALEQNLYFVTIPEEFNDKIELYNTLKNNGTSNIPDINKNYCKDWLELVSNNKTNLSDYKNYDSQDLKTLTPCFYTEDKLIFIFRTIVSLMTLIILIFLVIRYYMIVSFNKYRMYLKPDDNICSAGYCKFMLLEIFVNLIHAPPGLSAVFEIPQRTSNIPAYVNVEVILSILCLFLRSYHIFKYFSFHSRWYSFESEKLCLECNTPLDSIFTIKAEFKEKPFILVGVTMVLSIFVFGYSLRCVEMFFLNSSNQDWRYYWNGLWCVIITMATVGFGDFYPVSVLGRVIVVIACFWGTFLISLMVAAMTVSVEFNTQEAISYDSIKAAHFELQFGTEATILIQNALRYKWLLEKADDSINFKMAKSLQFKKLKDSLEKFRKLKKSKNDSIEAMIIELSVNKIEENLTIEMEKIKNQLSVVYEIKDLLEEYSTNQQTIKDKNLEIYRELQEMCIIKEKFV